MALIYRVVITGDLYGQICQNVVHFRPLNDVNTAQQLANTIKNDFIGWMKGPLNQNVRWTLVEVWDETNLNLAPFRLPFTITGAGGLTDQALTYDAYVFQKKTLRAGRKGRGRWYQWGINRSHFSNGIISVAGSSAWAAALVGLKGLYINPPATSGFQMVVKHKGPELAWDDVTDILLRRTAGTMRSRNIGTGV